jgi:hypothetical protein
VGIDPPAKLFIFEPPAGVEPSDETDQICTRLTVALQQIQDRNRMESSPGAGAAPGTAPAGGGTPSPALPGGAAPTATQGEPPKAAAASPPGGLTPPKK